MDRIVIAFSNKLGNFIFMTAAVKILRNWGYDEICLLTDPDYIRRPWAGLAKKIFDGIYIAYDESLKDDLRVAGWSIPKLMSSVTRAGFNAIESRGVYWRDWGLHEVQLYLNMIGASWNDFDGYLLEPDDKPILALPHPIIALANCSGADSQLKRWEGFPALSRILKGMEYSVVLVGSESELRGCSCDRDFVGKLTIEETAKVIQQCDLLIAPSTGLAVVADAVNTSVLQLDGPIPTTKTHPLCSSYRTVSKFISCAPCFQSLLYEHCNTPICMNEIRVEDVITKAIELLDKPRKQSVIEVTFGRLEKVVDQPLRDCRARVAYLVACYNRVHLLERFLASFSQSIPQEGDVFFLNDASDDPRVEEMLQGFNVEGLKKHVLHVDRGEKVVFLSSYKKMPSARAYNQLFKAALEVHEQTPFDFLTILDPDALMRPMWSQKLILTYRDAVKYHPEIGLFSAFNNENHPIYECKDSNVVFAGPVGKYRLRNGVNLQFMLTPEFFKGHHGFYEYEHSYSTKSSDLPKNEMLAAKGFKSMILVPSMLQHMGAYDSALPRRRSNELAGDFI